MAKKKAPTYGGYSGASQASTVNSKSLDAALKSYKAPAPVTNTSNTNTTHATKAPVYQTGRLFTPAYSPAPTYSAPTALAPAPAPAPAQTAPDQNTWLASDAGYKAQLAALTQALSDYGADNTRQQQQYTTDYGNSLKSLGYDPNSKQWNTQDTNTAAGRASQNLNNDFATRGLLQSSLYGEAENNLMRSLSDQLTGIDTAKQNFLTNLTSQLSAYKNQNNASQQQAKADALARYAAQYGA